jgi:hypothetical protein
MNGDFLGEGSYNKKGKNSNIKMRLSQKSIMLISTKTLRSQRKDVTIEI